MKSILLVEDDPFIVEIYGNQLRKEGFKVRMANDGAKALEKIAEEMPDLLLLDINLPSMSGWEVLGKLRADAKTKELKTIILSNNNKEESLGEIESLKPLHYFLKVETATEDIVNTIKEILT